MRIRPAYAAGTAPPRFVVGKERHRSKWAMRGSGLSALRRRARQGPHNPPVRRPPAPLARALPASLGRMPRTKSRDHSRERECAVAGSRRSRCLQWMLLRSPRFSSREPLWKHQRSLHVRCIRYSFPVCMRGIAEAPWGLDNFSRSPTDAR